MKAQTGIKARYEGRIYKIETSDVEGTKVTNVILAVPTTVEKKIKTVYAEISFWGKQSELINQYTVGDQMWAEGLEECIPYLDSDNNPQVRHRMRFPYVWNAEKNQSETETQDNSTKSNQPDTVSADNYNDNTDIKPEERTALEYVLNSGKYKGMKVADVLIKDAGYIHKAAISVKTNENIKKTLIVAYNYFYRITKAKSTAVSNTSNNNADSFLNYCLNSGRYKGWKMSDVLCMDSAYVHSIASNEKIKADIRSLFIKAYNFYYKAISYIFEDGKYKGQKISDVYKSNPLYIKELANTDIRFSLAYDFFYKKFPNQAKQPTVIEGTKAKGKPSIDYSQVPDGDLPF